MVCACKKVKIGHRTKFRARNKCISQNLSGLCNFKQHLTSGVLILIHSADACILVVVHASKNPFEPPYGLTWFMFDSFCACNSNAVLRIAQGKTTRMFPKRVILICATSDTQNSEFFWQNSSIGEWTFVLQCLSCQDSAAAKIWVEMYVWIAEFQFIVLHNKCVSKIINCLLLSCFWALMAYYSTIWYWRWCTFLWTS